MCGCTCHVAGIIFTLSTIHAGHLNLPDYVNERKFLRAVTVRVNFSMTCFDVCSVAFENYDSLFAVLRENIYLGHVLDLNVQKGL